MNLKNTNIELSRAPALDFKANLEDGTFTGYASLFGVKDLGDDMVMKGAFSKSLKSRPAAKVKMLWQHKWEDICGVWETVEEDEKGLFVKGRIIQELDAGKKALILMREKAIDTMSIGFRTIKDEWKNDCRLLHEVELHEISIVTFGMLPSARINKVKGLIDENQVKSILVEAGLSEELSSNIALHGVKKAIEGGNVDSVMAGEIVKMMERASNALRR